MLHFSYIKMHKLQVQNGSIFQTRLYFHKANKCNICTFCLFFVVANRDAWLKGPSRAAIWSMIACIYPCNWNNERWLLWAISHKFLIFCLILASACQCAGRSFGEETLRISFASPQTVIFFPPHFFFFILSPSVCLSLWAECLILRSSPRCPGVLMMFWWEQSKTEPKYSWYS